MSQAISFSPLEPRQTLPPLPGALGFCPSLRGHQHDCVRIWNLDVVMGHGLLGSLVREESNYQALIKLPPKDRNCVQLSLPLSAACLHCKTWFLRVDHSERFEAILSKSRSQDKDSAADCARLVVLRGSLEEVGLPFYRRQVLV